MDSTRSSPAHSRTHSVIPSAHKNRNGNDKDVVVSTSAELSSNRIGNNTRLPPYNRVAAVGRAEGFVTSPPASVHRSSLNRVNRTSIAEIPVFNRMGHTSGHPSFGPYANPFWNQVNAPLRNVDSSRNTGAVPLLNTRRNERLPMVPESVPRGANTDAWINNTTSLRHPSAENAPHQNSKWLTLLNVTNLATSVMETRLPVPVLSSKPPRLPLQRAHSPIPKLQSSSSGALVVSVASAKASRDVRRKKQREAVKARRGVNQGKTAASPDVGREPMLRSTYRKGHGIAKKVQRRLQNRASVQKCRARQRSRLEEMADERDALAVENKILLRTKKEIDDSGAIDLVAKWDKEAEEMKKSRESDQSKTKIVSAELSHISDADVPFARRYLVPPGPPSIAASTAAPATSFAARRDVLRCHPHALLPDLQTPSHGFNDASPSFVPYMPFQPSNSGSVADIVPLHPRPYPLNSSSTGLNEAVVRGNYFHVTGPSREQFMQSQGVGAYLHRHLPIAAFPTALPTASGALVWNNTSRGNMNYGVGSAQGEFDGSSQVRKRLRMNDSEDETHPSKRRNTNSM